MELSTVELLRRELVTNETVTTLVETRVYPQVLPQGGDLPAVALTVISDVPYNSYTGERASSLTSVRVQVDCWAETYIESQRLADAVDKVLSRLADPDNLCADRENRSDDYDDETQLHGVRLDFLVARGV